MFGSRTKNGSGDEQDDGTDGCDGCEALPMFLACSFFLSVGFGLQPLPPFTLQEFFGRVGLWWLAVVVTVGHCENNGCENQCSAHDDSSFLEHKEAALDGRFSVRSCQMQSSGTACLDSLYSTAVSPLSEGGAVQRFMRGHRDEAGGFDLPRAVAVSDGGVLGVVQAPVHHVAPRIGIATLGHFDSLAFVFPRHVITQAMRHGQRQRRRDADEESCADEEKGGEEQSSWKIEATERNQGVGHFARTAHSHSSAINWWPE